MTHLLHWKISKYDLLLRDIQIKLSVYCPAKKKIQSNVLRESNKKKEQKVPRIYYDSISGISTN